MKMNEEKAMSEQENYRTDTGSSITPYIPPAPQASVFYGWASNPDNLDDWPNSLAIEITEGYSPAGDTERPPDFDCDNDPEQEYVDRYGNVGLVLVDTNYKPTRTGEHPVRLTRPDAAKAAAALVETVQDTLRGGKLRTSETAELLSTLQSVDSALLELREELITDMTSADEKESAE